VYNLQDGDIAVPVPVPEPQAARAAVALPGAAAAPASFAEAPLDPTAAQLDLLATAGDTVLAVWMRRIASLVSAAESPQALRDSLLQAFGDLPTEQLTEVMALAFAAAELAGMAAVADGQ